MKKASQYSLLLATCAFIVFIAGIFWGRRSDYHLSAHTDNSTQSTLIPDALVTYSKEVYINGKMNINAAEKEDLTLLPGIGDTLAQRIIAYREENGRFSEVDELLLVDGIGTSKLSKIEEYITVGAIK